MDSIFIRGCYDDFSGWGFSCSFRYCFGVSSSNGCLFRSWGLSDERIWSRSQMTSRLSFLTSPPNWHKNSSKMKENNVKMTKDRSKISIVMWTTNSSIPPPLLGCDVISVRHICKNWFSKDIVLVDREFCLSFCPSFHVNHKNHSSCNNDELSCKSQNSRFEEESWAQEVDWIFFWCIRLLWNLNRI